MLDRTMGVVALAGLAAFLGVLLLYVPRADLIAVTAACFALAAFDLANTLRRKR